ncbi:2,4-dienoyl-CoA reductase [Geobacillus stearothermophilus]
MNGKVVIVTGGSSGMGKYMAKRFVSEGANVVITGRRADALEEAKREIAAPDGGRVLTVPMDVRNPEQVAEMVGRADAEFGRIDALVNNAAGNFIFPAEKLSINGWNSVINIVLNGTFYCSREVGNYWVQRGLRKYPQHYCDVRLARWRRGHSFSERQGWSAGNDAHACCGMGKKYGFRVNAIAPGPIERTGGAERLWESEEAERMTLESVPLGRLGTPEEIVAVASFLLSDEAAYINGACITVDGGQWLNRRPF